VRGNLRACASPREIFPFSHLNYSLIWGADFPRDFAGRRIGRQLKTIGVVGQD
jgi:hypothetical protein